MVCLLWKTVKQFLIKLNCRITQKLYHWVFYLRELKNYAHKNTWTSMFTAALFVFYIFVYLHIYIFVFILYFICNSPKLGTTPTPLKDWTTNQTEILLPWIVSAIKRSKLLINTTCKKGQEIIISGKKKTPKVMNYVIAFIEHS